jgi:alkyl sulfatase BDS1-like metallo-beta-lactamase superfamily hydrolase
MRTTCKATLIVFILLAFSTSGFTGTDYEHFHPKGKMPSKFTVEKQQQLRKTLPFEDKRDFE